MKTPFIAAALTGVALVGGASLFVEREVAASKHRLDNPEALAEAKKEEEKTAVADYTEADYCTPKFKEVLSRVVSACGLSGQDARRGCEPVAVSSFASITDDDFNALFDPLVNRGAIVMFDDNSDKLDDAGKKLIEERWADRKSAKYFFIVARASKTGLAAYNDALSQKRANSVFFHLEETTKETDLGKRVGMLWLGSQYAQLKKDYCGTWKTSRGGAPPAPLQGTKPAAVQKPVPGAKCDEQAINRSAFISWVDCRL